ncbi:unnamed protein product (macronuclear) [Paramecium tetraurelia]|uniref:Uncharacterized protein n=1 Tax=Paramecium tetraurelia TaxID=5888 RepID=A0CM68_PARTE|nr:uncharacterized protein GSPATT00008364001 [Paramecium tetraurelia]CAK71885.1 unnamed protein product [Paramecium tetraurelia]|eukprot:XP_001439282.1 hypothetical protein (macronuclear) [Paramecium tetraurelia strain d4-2]
MIQALTKMDPIQQYYVNDDYIKSISQREIKTNTSYSPKALIKGYWKKNYSPFVALNSSNQEKRITLPQINAKSYISNDSRNEENQNDVTSSFIHNIHQEPNLSKYQIKPACANYYQMRKEKYSVKIPGKIIKGSFSHNKNIKFRSPKQNPNNGLTIEQMGIKQLTQANAKRKSSASNNSSFENTFPYNQPVYELSKSPKTQFIRPITSLPKQTSEIQIKKPFINTVLLQLEQLKITNSQINNVVLIVFDELLGFCESSYYGFQQDFLQSQLYIDYQHTKDHYFSKLVQNSTIYTLTNLKDMIFVLSKNFQLIFLTKHFQNQLIEYVNINRLPIAAIYQMKDMKKSSINLKALNCMEILNDLQLNRPSNIIIVQTYETTDYNSNQNINIYEQSIIYPYGIENGINHFYTLILPNLTMQCLLKNDQKQSHQLFHSLYYIEQFCQSLLVNCLFDRKNQNFTRFTNSFYIEQLLEKIEFKLNQIDNLQSSQNLQSQKYSKKEMIIRIVEKFENPQKYQELSSDLVFRNKKIIKRIGRYKQESINLLLNVKEQLSQEFELLNYCQTLLENCYYIIL